MAKAPLPSSGSATSVHIVAVPLAAFRRKAVQFNSFSLRIFDSPTKSCSALGLKDLWFASMKQPLVAFLVPFWCSYFERAKKGQRKGKEKAKKAQLVNLWLTTRVLSNCYLFFE